MADLQTQLKFLADTDDLESGITRAKESSNDAAQAVSDGWKQAGMTALNALQGVASQAEETHIRTKEQIEKATSAADLLSDVIGVKVPGALQKMAAESEIAGPILESALPVLAAIAMAQAIVAIINKVRDLISSFRELSDEEKSAIDARVESLKKSISFDRQVLAIRRETILVGKSEAEQARLRAQWAAEDANEDKHYLERARKKYDDAKALLAAAEKGETKQVESDYRNPRTGMRAVHNVPVISDEQIKDAKAKIQTLEGLYGAGLQDLSRETLLFNEKSALADKQAGQARIDGQKQQNQSVTALQSANAKDVQAVQKDSNDKQAQEDERRKQEAIRAEQQKNEAIKKAEADAREAQEETIKGEIEDAKLKEQTEEQLVQQQFIKGQISKQQEIAALATAKQNELQIEIDYWRAIEQPPPG